MAVQVAEQIIAYLKSGTIINAVNVPAVSGELLQKIGPLLTLADPRRTFAALKALDLLVVMDYYMTPTAAMADALDRAEDDNGVRAVFLHGTQDCFTAG